MPIQKIEITQEDINIAYTNQRAWWLDPEFTPLAIAIRRLKIAEKVTVDYHWANLDGVLIPLPEEAEAYILAFGYSLLGPIPPKLLETMKTLRKTSSDHQKPVAIPKSSKRVEPTEFELTFLD